MRLAPRWLFVVLASALSAAALAAQAPKPPYEPRVGQAGKDVVWVPSKPEVVELMLDLARVTRQDFVVDLGSGDGRNVIAAARRGARALGIEYDADLVELSKRAASAASVADKATFVQADMFAADFSHANVLVLFLLPDNLRKLAPRFRGLRPGTRIVSNTFEIGGGWAPDETFMLDECLDFCAIHLYVVPAQVAGTWRLPHGVLRLAQDLQNVSGEFEAVGASRPIENVVLRGDQIHFTVDSVAYSARVKGDSMTGLTRGGGSWTAQRLGD
jgi:SAM-dependent methyltransferase